VYNRSTPASTINHCSLPGCICHKPGLFYSFCYGLMFNDRYQNASLHFVNYVRSVTLCHWPSFHSLLVALVISRLNYGNSLLIGLPKHLAFNRCKMHLHGWSSNFNASVILLASLHWLRIMERVFYKIAILTFKVLHGIAPEYLGPVVRVADLPGRQALRSASTNRLVVPPF